jgi:hypothetical protein
MSDSAADLLTYYTRPGIMTDTGEYASMLAALPAQISALCRVVQGLLLHIFWAERYGVELTEERKQELNIRSAAGMLARIRELSGEPLAQARPQEQKLVGNCRDFSVLLCALLRHQGVPARARCGFGAYFHPGSYEDHWVCEVWDAAPGNAATSGHWRLVDAQLDGMQREALGIGFDPVDVPRDQFLVGGKAWQLCRTGQADPDRFGIFDMHGMWFIRGDLVRDFLAFNKTEILPWDDWGLISKQDQDLTAEDLALLDHMASLTLAGDSAFREIRDLYAKETQLHPPPDWPHDTD